LGIILIACKQKIIYEVYLLMSGLHPDTTINYHVILRSTHHCKKCRDFIDKKYSNY